MTDASDAAYLQAWERFAGIMKAKGCFNATRSLLANDPKTAVAMFQWMERQPMELRDRLCGMVTGSPE